VTDEERDAHLDSVLIGGREPVTVVVHDPDPEWPDTNHYADAKSAVIAEIPSRARTGIRRRP
jgi:hypothetical protein